LIHSTAIIHPGAEFGDGVSVDAYAVIGEHVQIGSDSRIGPHTVIRGPTRIGSNNRIFQFCSIGDDPQDRKFAGEQESRLEIGDNNVIREYCSINRGTGPGGGVTRVGNNNLILAYSHIAHDCRVGNGILFANNATLAGHVSVDDFAVLGGFTGVHQFCRIGTCSLTAIASVVVKDVPPYVIVAGNTARPRGLNRVGLRRNGFSKDSIAALGRAYRVVYREDKPLREALRQLEPESAVSPEVAHFVDFFNHSTRGTAR